MEPRLNITWLATSVCVPINTMHTFIPATALLATLLVFGCAAETTCGPGTVLFNGSCIAAPESDASADAGADTTPATGFAPFQPASVLSGPTYLIFTDVSGLIACGLVDYNTSPGTAGGRVSAGLVGSGGDCGAYALDFVQYTRWDDSGVEFHIENATAEVLVGTAASDGKCRFELEAAFAGAVFSATAEVDPTTYECSN